MWKLTLNKIEHQKQDGATQNIDNYPLEDQTNLPRPNGITIAGTLFDDHG